MKRYRRIGITVKSAFDRKDEALIRVLRTLKKEGCTVCVDSPRLAGIAAARGCPPICEQKNIDLLIVLGGDGTVLRSLRELKNFSMPIVAVNRGTVGFLAEVELKEVEEILPLLIRGKGVVEERSLLTVTALRGDAEIFSGIALNEAVIARGTIARLIDLKTTLDDHPLTTFLSDGLMIATPTGSTAYSLAAGGPIVHPAFGAALILTPINPYSFSQKPIVLRGESVVDVMVHIKTRKFSDVEVNLTIDGQLYVPLRNGDHIRVTTAKQTVKFLRRSHDSFVNTLRTKLKWGDRARMNRSARA